MSEKIETKVRGFAAKDAAKAIKKVLDKRTEVQFSDVIKEINDHPEEYPYLTCYETAGRKSTVTGARDTLGLFVGKNKEGKSTIRTTPWASPETKKPEEKVVPTVKKIEVGMVHKESVIPDATDLLMRSLEKNGAAHVAALESVRKEFAGFREEMKGLREDVQQLYDCLQVFSRSTWTQLDMTNDFAAQIAGAVTHTEAGRLHPNVQGPHKKAGAGVS